MKQTERDTMKPMDNAWKILKMREGEPYPVECRKCGGYFDAQAGMTGEQIRNACPHCRRNMRENPNFEPEY
tara:strand:+ start:1246 stop:1458 length:213 start_codon:yes stop_codon:yes gene_type:complete